LYYDYYKKCNILADSVKLFMFVFTYTYINRITIIPAPIQLPKLNVSVLFSDESLYI